jgi:hypothetical protein
VAVPFLSGIDVRNQRILAVASPSSGTDAANKQYVDDNLTGLRWKQPVRVATTTAGTLASSFENGDTVDGVTLATGDRILIKDQAAATENGIYVVSSSGAPSRATDADSTSELNAATALVLSGTVNADKAYTQITDNPTIGSSPVTFVQFGGGTPYTADGQGIELAGTTFSLELDGVSLVKSGTGVRIGAGAAGTGLTESAGVLAVNPGAGLEVASDAVRIATGAVGAGLTGGGGSPIAVDTSVVARKFSQSIGDGSATNIIVTHGLGTKDVSVTLRQVSDDAYVYADVAPTSTTQVTVGFGTPPATGSIRCTVIG